MSVDDPDRSEGFLTRWSRRKREIASEEAAAAPVLAPESAEAAPSAEPEEEFDLSLLPDVETLTTDSDITLFLKKGVPEALKNAALRKMWSADAAIRDYIGPVDYQWDFNDPAGVPGFGPIGADVDVEALLRQVMGEKKPAPESVATVENVPAPEHLHQTKVEEDDAAALPAPDDETQERLEFSQEPGSENAIPEISVPKEDSSTPAPRRHGGALPL